MVGGCWCLVWVDFLWIIGGVGVEKKMRDVGF